MKKITSALIASAFFAFTFTACDDNTQKEVQEAVNESAPVKYLDTALQQVSPDKKTSTSCLNNLKSTGLGLMIYVDDNDGNAPQTLDELNEYGISAVCPADSVPYEYKIPGVSCYSSENLSSTAAAVCPVHGHRLLMDGHVEKGK